MIHQFSSSCERFFKLCEEPTFKIENKNIYLYQTLAELNYFLLNLNESKSKYESSSEPDLKDNVIRLTDDQARPLISKSFPDLRFYWCILNPNGMNEEPQYGTGDAIDDILDIYKDLKEGYEHYKSSNYGEAVYVWTYSYEIHWGEHLVELQDMLYDLIY